LEDNKNTLASRSKKIWIDLDNSPHVPFFSPIIKELNKRGYQVTLTARDCFQVCGLAELFNLEYKRIGRHYGKNRALKVAGTLIRSFQLLPTALKEKPALSVSHGSRSAMITAALLNIPIVLIGDYEFAEILPFVRLRKMIVPEVVSTENFPSHRNRVYKYPGIKEDVYVLSFKPDPTILHRLGIKEEDLVVTIRPPATEAHYHNPESEKLFFEVVEFLGHNPGVRIVILPRNEKKQTAWIKDTWSKWCHTKKIIIPDHVVNGLDLIWYSDFVVSGGGTMNREAAALGVPVYSIFRGKIGAVDRYLSDEGRLTLLESADDVRKKMKVARRDKSQLKVKRNEGALKAIMKNIVEILEKS
jgi:predicted glycosyltransferase